MVVQATERHYQGEAGRRYQQHKRAVPDRAVPWVARLRAEKLAPWIKPDAVVLEYGVGLGWNLAALNCGRKIGFDVGDDLEPVVRALGVEYLTETKSVAGRSIDVVLCHHTLEHLLHPPEALREMERLLAPGGRLLLFTPLEREHRYLKFEPDEPNHHLYSWNPQTLGNLVQEIGLRVVKAGPGEFGYDRFAAVWAVKCGVGETGFRLLRRLLHILKPARETRVIAALS